MSKKKKNKVPQKTPEELAAEQAYNDRIESYREYVRENASEIGNKTDDKIYELDLEDFVISWIRSCRVESSPHYEWQHDGCPWDSSGELVHDGNIDLSITVEEFFDEYTGSWRATFMSGMGKSYETYGDDFSYGTMSLGEDAMADAIRESIDEHFGVSITDDELVDVIDWVHDDVYDECLANEFFSYETPLELSGIGDKTLDEVLHPEKYEYGRTSDNAANDMLVENVECITQKEFAGHFGLDWRDIGHAVKDELLKHDSEGRIAKTELSRDYGEIASLVSGARRYELPDAAQYMQIPLKNVKALFEQQGISPIERVRDGFGGRTSLYAQRDLDELTRSGEYIAITESIRKKRQEKEERERRLASYKQHIEDRITVNIRTRSRPLPHAHLFLGPTNSGKTHAALEEMAALYEENPEGRYVYAGPLRLLAYEVYCKMSFRFGEDAVGFVTGEEQLNPDAPILCCTVECAPMRGTALVLDETHWITDADRGRNWTNLLIGADYEYLFAISAAETRGVIANLLKNASETSERSFSRLLPVEYAGTVPISQIAPKTAIVAFSRKAVLALAREISKRTSRKVGVLYGAMPLMTRKKVLDDYASGTYDAIVCTDVIGHGINLPIDNLVFAETQKYDGTTRRDLRIWEAAQIAGRSGRYGISEQGGKVGVLSGLPWLSPSKNIAKHAVAVTNGEEPADLSVRKSYITPSFDDVAVEKPVELLYALECWEQKAKEACKGTSLSPSEMPEKKALIEAIAGYLGAEAYPKATAMDDRWKMTAEQLWKLSEAPLDPRSSVLSDVVAWASSESPDESSALASPLNWLSRASGSDRLDEDGIRVSFDERREELDKWASSMDLEELSELEEQAKSKREIVAYNERISKERKAINKRNKSARKKAKKEGTVAKQEKLLQWKLGDGTFTNDGGKFYNAQCWNDEFSDVPLARNVAKRRNKMESKMGEALAACRRWAADGMDRQERTYRELCQLSTIYNIFGSLGTAPIGEVKQSIARACETEEELMGHGIRHNAYGICESCGGQCAPWFYECDECHSARYSWRGGYYDGDWW